MLKNKYYMRLRVQAGKMYIFLILYICILCGAVALYQYALAQAKVKEAVSQKLLVDSNISLEVLSDREENQELLMANNEQVENKLSHLEKFVEKKELKWKLERKRLRAIRREKKRLLKMKQLCGVKVDRKQQAILERIVEAEAGGEDMTGKILVANVVLNRVKSEKFPSTVKGVVFAHSGNRYQFSPLSDGRYYKVSVSKETREAVERALNGENPSQGALYFMARQYASPSNVRWFDTALTKVVSHGVHEFYR